MKYLFTEDKHLFSQPSQYQEARASAAMLLTWNIQLSAPEATVQINAHRYGDMRDISKEYTSS